MLRQDVDILLERRDVGLAFLLGEPAAQSLERPDIADPGLLLDDAVDGGDGVERILIVERFARRQFDQDVDRVGAGQLRVETPAGLDRLLLVRHLIRQPVPWIKIAVEERKAGDDQNADGAVDEGMADHPLGDPATDRPQHVDGRI